MKADWKVTLEAQMRVEDEVNAGFLHTFCQVMKLLH
jgi:hypothetical protein